MFYFFLIYTFMLPLEYLQDRIPKGPTGINYLSVSLLALLLWFLLARPKRGEGFALTRSPLNAILLAYLAFCYFGMIMTSFTFPDAPDPFSPGSMFVTRMLAMLTCFLLFWLGANMLDTRRKIQSVLLAMALCSPLVFRAFRNTLSSVSAWHYSHDMRVAGPFTRIGSNELGAFFVYGSVFFLLFAFSQRRHIYKLMFLAIGAFYTYGVLYSYSRASQLGFGVGLLAAVPRYKAMIVVAALGFVTSPMWLPQSVVDRWDMTFDDTTGEMDDSASSREVFWKLAREYFMESPLIGNGFDSYQRMNPAGMDTHNIYYRVLAEQGLIGIGLFMSMWAAILYAGVDLARKARKKWDRNFGWCLVCATLSIMAVNYFGDRFTHLSMIGHYWILVGIAFRLRSNMYGVEVFPDDDIEPDAASARSKEALEAKTGDTPSSSTPVPARPGPMGPGWSIPGLAIVGRDMNHPAGMATVGGAREVKSHQSAEVKTLKPVNSSLNLKNPECKLNIVGGPRQIVNPPR